MSEQRETSAEEALILITCACTGADRVRAFMRRAKIRPAKGATITDAITSGTIDIWISRMNMSPMNFTFAPPPYFFCL